MKRILIIFFVIFSTLFVTACTEKISYTGKILKSEDNIKNYKNKDEVTKNMGFPNYIDPIEKKYFYFSETNLSKNFFDNEIIERKLIVFSFDLSNNIEVVNIYELDDQNQIKINEDETSGEIIKKGLLEKVFGGVGAPSTLPTN